MNNKTASSLQVVGYASFTQRFYAFIIDCFVFLPLNLWSQHNIFNTKSFAIASIITLVWCLYKPWMDWKFGGTIGKLVMKIRVVDMAGMGITLNQSFLRFAPYFAISLSTLLSTYVLLNLPGFDAIRDFESAQEFEAESSSSLGVLLTYFAYLFSISSIFLEEKKQAVHDKIANCYCVLIQPLSKEQKAEDLAASQQFD
ncbi:MAG: RDD family protein [Aureispira sp.]